MRPLRPLLPVELDMWCSCTDMQRGPGIKACLLERRELSGSEYNLVKSNTELHLALLRSGC